MEDMIKTRVDRWMEFTAGGGEPFLFLIAFPEATGKCPFPNQNYKERIDWAVRFYEAQMTYLGRVTDDAIPCLRPYTGTEIFAEAFGCHVSRPADNMPHSRPLFNESGAVGDLEVPAPLDTSLAKVFEIADELRRRCGRDTYMKLPDIQSPMGIAAMLLDKSAFLAGLIEDPERIRGLAAKAMSLLTAFLDEWFRRYGTDYIAHHPEYFMRRGVTLSDDEIGSVSNAMYEEHFLPDLIALSKRYGGLGMHCCADCQRHWGSFLKIPQFKALNLSMRWLRQPDATARQAYPFFAGKLIQVHKGRAFTGRPWTWPEQVPENAHAVFLVDAPNAEEAVEISEKMSEVRERMRSRAGS